MVGFWISIGWTLRFRWGLGWIRIGWFGLAWWAWWWCGGDCGGSCLVVVGHCGGFVLSSLVTMVGLFGRCWSWWGLFLLCSSLFIVLVWFKMILFVVEWFVVTRKLDGGGGGGGWMRQSKRNGDYREVRNTFYIILMYCMVK